MTVNPRLMAVLLLFGSCALVRAQEAKNTSAESAASSSNTINEIGSQFEEAAAKARAQFMRSVADARKVLEQAITDADQKRVKALTQVQDSAMRDKNLDLAVAARDEIAKPVAENAKIVHENSGHRDKVKIEIAAEIDGSDYVTITQDKMIWKHHSWELPPKVMVNGMTWNISKSDELANAGTMKYLPFVADFSTARVLDRGGRDVVAMEKSDKSLTVIFSDTQEGTDIYSITIEVQAALVQNAGTR